MTVEVPTPRQRLSEIVNEARGIDWPDFDEHGDAMVVAGCRVVRFLPSAEAVEVLARQMYARFNNRGDWDFGWENSTEVAKVQWQDGAREFLNTIAEQALKEPSHG